LSDFSCARMPNVSYRGNRSRSHPSDWLAQGLATWRERVVTAWWQGGYPNAGK
jgi:hypothetical protein